MSLSMVSYLRTRLNANVMSKMSKKNQFSKMGSMRSPSSPSDGYKRFSDDFANTSINNYGSNVSNTRTGTDGAGDSGTLDMGSRSSLHTGLHMSEDEHWEMNYHEAAIYLEEGLNNEKFDSHPSSPEELPAYLRVHNPWYHGLDLLASLVLILLAFTEDPAVPTFEFPVWAHGTIELLALTVIGVELHLKLKWIGWGTILKHKRTMIKGITLLIMVLEAVVVLCRQSSHFRVTRALRPIFLVDTRHCGGVRRFIRQILQSLPPIIDMLGLLMFFVATYSLLGYYLFSEHVDNGHFQTISDSFVSMFVLLTTANFPDVMMPSYAKSKWYAVFFILYIITVLYVLMNLMLAVVYETFTRIEREKCRALLLHRRRAARHAFRLLVSRRAPHAVRLRHFAGLMRHYAPHYSGLDVYLMFKQLNQSSSGGLSRSEFANLYEVFALRWAGQQSRAPWYSQSPLEPIGRAAAAAVRWPYFEYLIYALIVGNGVALVLRVCEAAGDLQDSARLLCASWDTWLFLTLFLVEAGLRMMASGLGAYLESGWNVFDLSVTLLALMGAVLLSIAPKLFIVVIFRPLRLMRLYKLKKRYRDVFGTLVLLSPLMSSAGCVMLVMYYFFAIIGMELFASYDLRNCCVNTTVEDFYKFSLNSSTALGYYYLNNFENIVTSGVTLFELTVVNNWFILMNAYATVSGQFSRIYFMVFYLFTMVVLTIVVASVLEAFRFRIQYKRSTTKRDEEKLLHEEVHTSWEEAQRLGANGDLTEELRPHLPPGVEVTFIGSRPRTKEVLQRRMYQTEIQKWLAEEDENEGSDREISDYNSDDSVKDKTYEPPKDLLDCSYISDSSEEIFTKSLKVKRKLSFSEESPQRHVKMANNEDTNLITLDDLLAPRIQSMSPTLVCSETPKGSTKITTQIIPASYFSLVKESSAFDQISPKFACFNNSVHEWASTSTNNNDLLDNRNITDKDHSSVFLTLPDINKSVNIADASINEDLTNPNGIMVADMNGNIYVSVDRQIINNIEIQEIDRAASSKSNTRKKVKNVTKWKRVAAKTARLKGSPYHSTVAKKNVEIDGRELKPPCTCKFKCYEKVPNETRILIFNEFWKKCTSWDQRRQFIASNVTKKLKRMMRTDGNLNTDRRKFSYEYRLIVNSRSEKICRNMFLITLSIGEKFVKVSLEKQLDGGLVAPDQRGKHIPGNKSSDQVVQSVIEHINLYPYYESHYSRQKSGRKFLGPDLNIPTMYKQYKEMMETKGILPNFVAKEWLYRNIFNTKFNLSFKLPSVDTCDDCDAFERKLLDVVDEELKNNIEKEKEVHAKAAEERYNLKRHDKKKAEESLGVKKVLMIDLQKCLPTPNLTNSKSFYLRKLWTLNLTIFDSTANSAANIIWSENIGARGGNEVASCLIRWVEENIEKLTNVNELTLWSDNCAGQNRNLMIVMAYTWILNKHPQLKIFNHKFMLKGHTHMEVDQIHSQIEKKKKQLKTMQIAIPRDWSQFIRTCGGRRTFNVYDMQLHDFIDVTSLYKSNGPFVSRKKNKDGNDFKISECVWLQVKQDQPGILFYKNTFAEDFSEISFIRNASKGIKFPEHLPSVRQSEKKISTAKYNDLMSLLQWVPQEFHSYYKNLKHSESEADFPEN